MDAFGSVNWSGFVGPLTTLAAAFLAYLFGQRTYRRQKEYELVRSRYLDGGVDRFAANVEYALGAIRHNWARTLQILRLFRDGRLKEAADLAERSSFRQIEPEKIDLVAACRVQTLTRDSVYARAHGLLFGLVNATENFFVNDVGALIRRAEGEDISALEMPGIFERALAGADHYQAETGRYYTLLYRLQDLGRLLERRHLTFRKIDKFGEVREVQVIGSKLLELFPPEPEEENLAEQGAAVWRARNQTKDLAESRER